MLGLNNLFDIFTPYLTFISFTITISVNLFLIIRKYDIIMFIIANIGISIIMLSLGLHEYDFLTIVITYLINTILDVAGIIIKGIADGFIQGVTSPWDNFIGWLKSITPIF